MASLAASFIGDKTVNGPARPSDLSAPRSPRAGATDGAYRFSTGGPNWPLLGLIGVAHVGFFALLLTTGAVHIGMPPPPVAINFVREIAEPVEPEVVPEAALEPVPTDIFVPDVIVETSVLSPPTVTVTDVPPPPKAVATPTMARGSGEAAVVPPDFSADQLNNAGPRYPSASRRAHEEGTVMLKVLVAPDGRAQDLLVATSSGFSRLDEAALATVKRWAFLPAKQAGRPVSAWVLVPVTFELGDDTRGGKRGRGRGGDHDRRPHDQEGPGVPGRDPLPTAT